MIDGRWVEQLFLEHGESYAKVLESLIEGTAEEVAFVGSALEQQGIGPGARVLDLGCGIGRHAVELARLGYRVTGVDLSPTYIERARQRAAEAGVEVEFVEGDMRALPELFEDDRFDAIVNLFGSFGYYDDETNEVVLACSRKVARDGAIFVLDTMNRDWMAAHYVSRGFDRVGDLTLLAERDWNQPAGRIQSRWTILESTAPGLHRTVAEIDLDLRVYGLNELVALFDGCDWAYRTTYGDLDGSPFEIGSRRIVALFAGR